MLTSYKLIHLEWTPPDNGGSDILSYIIYYKLFNLPDYEELVGEVSGFDDISYMITYGIIEGAQYDFKIKALNRWGESEWWSDPTTILAASTPYQI